MLLVLTLLAGAVLAESAVIAQPLSEIMTFQEWRAHYETEGNLLHSQHAGKSLSERENQFNKNIEKIKKQNALHDAGLSGFRFGVNQFADLSADEFSKAVGLGQPRPERTIPRNEVWLDTSNVPASQDWRTKNAVTPVKNQGQCGSCWSFSTTGAIEGAVAVDAGKLVSLSEKQLCDCSKKNNGCQGGLMDLAFQYVIDNGGIDSEDDYPYQPTDGTCRRTLEAKHVATIGAYVDVTVNNADQLKAAVANRPVAIAIEADQEVFQLYTSGVLDSYQCGTQLDHGVLVVGYTEENDRDYPDAWIVKNSWGAGWGKQGYIYISRTTKYSASGICGILEDPSYPTGGGNGPSPSPGPSPTPAPGNGNYENPFLVKGCKTGEVNITVGEPSGSFCAPVCNGPTDMNCPAAPSGFTASPGCNLADSMINSHFCSLTCNPYNEDTGCGNGASCGVFCNSNSCNWMCLYHLNHEATNATMPLPTSGLDRLHKLQYDQQ